MTRGTQPTLSRGKGSLAWVRDLSANSIWRMPVDQSRRPPEPLTNSAALTSTRNGRATDEWSFAADRSGVNELWIAMPTDPGRGRRRGFGARSWAILTGRPMVEPLRSRATRMATLTYT